MYNYDGWYPYVISPQLDSLSLPSSLGSSTPFVHKPISKEARMALKRKRKQVKISRKKNR
jgi:hypothetical protein